MLGVGILTLAVTMKGLKNGEKWAITSILLSGIASGSPFWAFTAIYFQNGLYTGTSGISLGIWLTILFYSPWVVGLITSAIGVRRSQEPQKQHYISTPP